MERKPKIDEIGRKPRAGERRVKHEGRVVTILPDSWRRRTRVLGINRSGREVLVETTTTVSERKEVGQPQKEGDPIELVPGEEVVIGDFEPEGSGDFTEPSQPASTADTSPQQQ